ncbi:MAG TPA: DUF4145 domain-containing protein [Sphingomonas sp.]|nr:DUF4145 domain-containing protein [Sphingomonas sp.]
MSDHSVEPKLGQKAFTCPHCGVLASQSWHDLIWLYSWSPDEHQTAAELTECGHCSKEMLWWQNRAVAPEVSTAPFPHVDMPASSRLIYDEARNVFGYSPRAAAALLRLCIEKIVSELTPDKMTLDQRIGHLVSDGLSRNVQKALDVVRVVGNNAVHPGQIAIDDNSEIAAALFQLINFVIERLITEPAKIGDLFDSLPEGARKAMERRDTAEQIEDKTVL